MSFAEEFRNLRLENLMTLEELAHKLGFPYATVNYWENGKSLPRFSRMPAIMEFCDEVGYDRQVIYQSWKEDKAK